MALFSELIRTRDQRAGQADARGLFPSIYHARDCFGSLPGGLVLTQIAPQLSPVVLPFWLDSATFSFPQRKDHSSSFWARLCPCHTGREHQRDLLKPVCDGWGVSCGRWWTSAHIRDRTFNAQHILYIIHTMPSLHMHTQQFLLVHGSSHLP